MKVTNSLKFVVAAAWVAVVAGCASTGDKCPPYAQPSQGHQHGPGCTDCPPKDPPVVEKVVEKPVYVDRVVEQVVQKCEFCGENIVIPDTGIISIIVDETDASVTTTRYVCNPDGSRTQIGQNSQHGVGSNAVRVISNTGAVIHQCTRVEKGEPCPPPASSATPTGS